MDTINKLMWELLDFCAEPFSPVASLHAKLTDSQLQLHIWQSYLTLSKSAKQSQRGSEVSE